ncbi:Mu homology domain-containing protein [Pterulicium gracile]|uniref:Mu homology domain-containing protein n=1 Tax=Pterulicium gracile TaxID=1884261 RepID=A0A5C3QK81_9AGAR|nr:Mu homology domain-containing protein [Pterula gracilis]
MPIDGLIILDSTGTPIIQSNFRSSPPSHPLLHIEALNTALQLASSGSRRPGDVDPVLFVQSHEPSACCHIQEGDVRILCPVTGDDDPLIAFAFIRTFVDILKDYFGPAISATVLQDNFDIIYQLLEETLDSSGYPLTTSLNLLKDIVLPPSLFSKFLAAAGASSPAAIGGSGVGGMGSGGAAGGGAFNSPIPWRKAGLRYNNNEIYFDMVEELRAIVNKNGVPVSTNVWGRVDVNCRLSGTPDLTLTFTNPKVLDDCSFHSCVRLQRFAKSKELSFVPPDGRFVLFEYRYVPPTSVVGASPTGGKDNVPVPLALKTKIDLADEGGTLDLTLVSKLTTRPLENVRLELYLGEGSGSVNCVASRAGFGGGGHGHSNVPGDASSTWAWDHKRRVLRWEMPSMPASSSWTLRGSWASSTAPARPARVITATYTINTFTYSSLAVDQLRLGPGENYKPYKGVRGRGDGKVEWRW